MPLFTETDRQSGSKVLAIVQLMMLTENYSNTFLNTLKTTCFHALSKLVKWNQIYKIKYIKAIQQFSPIGMEIFLKLSHC